MKIANLQTLRFLAAFLVVLHHVLPHYTLVGGASAPMIALSEWGFAGVDVFFVISGFVITKILHVSEDFSWTSFLVKRVCRIFLGYWPFLIFGLILVTAYIPHKLAHLDLIGSIFLTKINMSELVLPVSWSLTFELYFYLLASMFILLPNKLLAVISIIFLGTIFITNINASNSILDSVYLSPLIFEFWAGTIIFYAIRSDVFEKNISLLLLAIATCAGVYFGVKLEAKDGLLRIATFGVGATALVAFVIMLESKVTSAKWLVYLGDSSYALYLCHLLWIWVFDFSGLRSKLDGATPALINISFGGLLLFCIVFSCLYYWLVEKPLYLAVLGRLKLKSLA